MRVSELNQRIQRALSKTFPGDVWVRGEIRGLRPNRSGHLYFELVDPADDPADDPGTDASGTDAATEPDVAGHRERGEAGSGARVSAVLWAGTHRRLRGGRLRRVPGFEFRDDVAVRVRGRLEYWPQGGRLQFVISDVDPEYTLGTLSATRDRVVAALSADGLLDRNGALPVSAVPLRVGLVTSHESAAFHDFVRELQGSGLGFEILHVDARVQGAGSERSLVAALRILASHPVDIVAIVRGGGSRTDLVVFDSELVARTIAAMPVPVFTGIGHEIDTSVADLVAHTAFKTPTACAGALVVRVAEFLGTLAEHSDSLCRIARDHVGSSQNALDDRAARIVVASQRALGAADQRLGHDGVRLRRSARQVSEQARHRVDRAAHRTRTTSEIHLARAQGRLWRAADRVRPDRVRQILNLEHHRLETLEARTRALDPSRILARGYSLSRTDDGRLVRSPADAPPGTTLTTILAQGQVRSVVVPLQFDGRGSDDTSRIPSDTISSTQPASPPDPEVRP